MGYILATVVIATCLVWLPGIHSAITKDNGVCGSTKGCFSIPDDCNPDVAGSCRAFSSWSLTEDSTSLLINLWSNTSTYIAMGFSKSGRMMDSDVYACTSELQGQVVRSQNPASGRNNQKQTLIGVNATKVISENGILSCSFVRMLQLESDDTFFDLTSPNKYTPILAWGGPVQDGVLSPHSITNRGFSDTETDFDGSGSDRSIKSHGTVIFSMLLCFYLVVFNQ